MVEKYARVLREITDKPWAIRQSKLETICAIVQLRASGVKISNADKQAAAVVAAARPTQQIIGTVGVLPVFGILAQRMNLFTEISGGTSYQQIIAQFRVMRDDPQVKAIVFEHDSPGGEVFGLIEAAEEIFAARDTKRLIAVVNPFSASASLFLACACAEIVVTPSGELGCIGTICCHTDYSKQNEMLGEDPTYIVSSPYKAEANQDNPLTDEAMAYLQSQVDFYGDQFEKFVAKGRGVPVSTVKRDFGQGRMMLAKDAVKVGLADRIATFDDVITKLVGGRKSTNARALKTTNTDVAVPKEDQHEPIPAARADAEAEEDTACQTCHGSGLTPERFMSDPHGQEPCPDCGGTGKATQAATTVDPVGEQADPDMLAAEIAAEHEAIIVALSGQ